MLATYTVFLRITMHFVIVLCIQMKYNDHIDIPTNESFILNQTDEIWSISNTSYLTMQKDGNFVFRRSITNTTTFFPVWATVTSGEQEAYFEITSNGNLMLRSRNEIFWESNTGNHDTIEPHRLVMVHDFVYLLNANSHIIWSPFDNCADDPRFAIKQPLYVIIPTNGSYKLCGDDGIYSDYDTSNNVLSGTRLHMQPNGKLVLFTDNDPQITTIWNTDTENIGATHTEISSDGNIMVKDYSDQIYWQSNTGNVNNINYQLQLGVVTNCVYLRNNDLNEIIWSEAQGTECVIPSTHNAILTQHPSAAPSQATHHPTAISLQPTHDPFALTTDHPSVSPTSYPISSNPSTAPVNYPTVSSSSASPTTSLVQSTSLQPTEYPIKLSFNIITSAYSETNSPQSTEQSTTSIQKSQSTLGWNVAIGIVGCCIGFLCCMCFMAWFKIKSPERQYTVNVDNVSNKKHVQRKIDLSVSHSNSNSNAEDNRKRSATFDKITNEGPDVEMEGNMKFQDANVEVELQQTEGATADCAINLID